MTRTHKLLLFYSVVVLALFDLNSIANRLFESTPDPIAWEKVVVAAIMQVTAVLIWTGYVWVVSANGAQFLDWISPYSLRGLGLFAAILAGVIAAYSVTLLHNGWNCGNHPIPTSRGMTTCPR